MSRFWSPIVADLTPYVPGEQLNVADIVKLNTNENPYPPSPAVTAAITAENGEGLRLYPDPEGLTLRRSIAARHGVAIDRIFVGNGSDEVLGHAFQALLDHASPLLFPDITYCFYTVYCGLYGINFEEVPVDADFRIRPEDYRRECGAIVIANPNAPTGRALTIREIETLVADHPDQVVVIDEAYVDFGAETAIPLTDTYDNLLVVQTFSKSRSLAGLRVGFAIGHPDLIAAITRVKDSFNSYPLGRMAIAGASAAMQDVEWLHETTGRIITSREWLRLSLEAMSFSVLPSRANFVFAEHPRVPGAVIAAELRARGILVRHFAKPRISNFVRITVGTEDQCARLIGALERIV